MVPYCPLAGKKDLTVFGKVLFIVDVRCKDIYAPTERFILYHSCKWGRIFTILKAQSAL